MDLGTNVPWPIAGPSFSCSSAYCWDVLSAAYRNWARGRPPRSTLRLVPAARLNHAMTNPAATARIASRKTVFAGEQSPRPSYGFLMGTRRYRHVWPLTTLLKWRTGPFPNALLRQVSLLVSHRYLPGGIFARWRVCYCSNSVLGGVQRFPWTPPVKCTARSAERSALIGYPSLPPPLLRPVYASTAADCAGRTTGNTVNDVYAERRPIDGS